MWKKKTSNYTAQQNRYNKTAFRNTAFMVLVLKQQTGLIEEEQNAHFKDFELNNPTWKRTFIIEHIERLIFNYYAIQRLNMTKISFCKIKNFLLSTFQYYKPPAKLFHNQLKVIDLYFFILRFIIINYQWKMRASFLVKFSSFDFRPFFVRCNNNLHDSRHDERDHFVVNTVQDRG